MTHARTVVTHAKHSNVEISIVLREGGVARSFVHKLRKELEASSGDVSPVGERKKYSQRSDSTRTQIIPTVGVEH